jgi:hypothetical protein
MNYDSFYGPKGSSWTREFIYGQNFFMDVHFIASV